MELTMERSRLHEEIITGTRVEALESPDVISVRWFAKKNANH